MRQLELRRHATRDPSSDALSASGRALAEDIGRAQADVAYDAVFVSPAARAAETAAWILRGAHRQLPPVHRVVPGLAGADASGGSPESMAAGIRGMLTELPEGGRGLAISHTPFVERAAFGLTGREIEPMQPGEGLLIVQRDDGSIDVEELRLARPDTR